MPQVCEAAKEQGLNKPPDPDTHVALERDDRPWSLHIKNIYSKPPRLDMEPENDGCQ